MQEKFTKVQQEFEKLSAELSSPEVTSNPEKLKVASQRFSQIEPVAKKIAELTGLEKKLAQAQAALSEETDEELLAIAQDEVESLSLLKEKLTQEITEDLSPKDPMDQKNIIVEIRAGTGGDEAALFAAELYRMYSRFAERQSWKTKILSSNRIGIGGFKEVVFEIAGKNVYKALKFESGVHRVQRVPDTEKNGRVHTSTITVAVLPEAEEIDLEIKSEDLRIDVFRAGGHGGQSVNTTDSAVRITHLPTGTVVSCQDEKSQQQNKAKAMQILRSRVLAAEQERLAKERGAQRNSQIGTGERSEKVRTYNFPQDRVTDHRINQNFGQIHNLMDGDISEIVQALQKADQE